MSKLKVVELAKELDEVFVKFSSNRWLLKEAILQMIDRENILTGNRLRSKYGEPEVVPERQHYKQKPGEWIIDVPREWVSLTGKDVA